MILLLSNKWINKDRYISLLNKAGFFDIKYGDENTEVRPDVLIVCFNYDYSQLSSIVDKNPFNVIFAIECDNLFRSSNLTHFTIGDDLLPALVKHRKKNDTILPLSTDKIPKEKRTRKAGYKKCKYCYSDVGNVGDSYDRHLEHCKEFLGRDTAYGFKKVYRKKDGRSIGSILYISIPHPVEVDNVFFNKGYHIITSRSLIKKTNDILNKKFKYRYECSSGEEC